MTSTYKLAPIAAALLLGGCGGSSDSNQAPQFAQPSISINLQEDTQYQGRVTATDAGPISYTLANAPEHGTIAVNSDGSFTYTPDIDFNGEDAATISASDGSLSANQEVRFVIENVNDIPQLVTADIFVTTSTTTEGTINISDADGDAISISIVQAPANGVLTIDANTGAFSFEAESLTSIDDSFTIAFTDGNIAEPVVAEIALRPSYITNEDKRNYYYSSVHSHLKQANDLSQNINDEVSRYPVYQALASGYVSAGFGEEAQGYLEKIANLPDLAEAYRGVAKTLDLTGQTQLSAKYRDDALAAYNQYIAQKGLDNISRNDASWLLGLVRNYLDAQQVQQAQVALSNITVYADAVLEEEYNTTYGFFLTSFINATEGAVDSYFLNPNETTLEIASVFAENLLTYANKTGYQVQTRGEFAGQRTERLKALYLVWAAELMYQINDVELAKKAVNQALAIYGITGFDSSYNYQASPYAQATLGTYTFPLESLSGMIEGLYPNAENPAFALLTEERDIRDAKEHMFGYSISTALLAGEELTAAVAEARASFLDNNDYNAFYRTLTNKDSTPGVARILHQNNRDDLAQQVLTYAGELLESDDYITNSSLTSYITGYRGCGLLIEITSQVNGNLAEAGQRCISVLNKLDDGSLRELSTSASITVHTEVLVSLDRANLEQQIDPVYQSLTNHISKQSCEEKFSNRMELLGYLVDAGREDLVNNTLDTAFADINSAMDGLTNDEVESVLSTLYHEVLGLTPARTGFWERYSLISSMGANATTLSDFAGLYQKAVSSSNTLADTLRDKILMQADTVIADNMENLVAVYTQLDKPAEALELIDHRVNGEADKLELYAAMASLVALKDDFRGSAIASVDTDHDGLPNFFQSGATEAQIQASGLVADQDSDNDGIADAEDVSPLGNN